MLITEGRGTVADESDWQTQERIREDSTLI